MTFAEAITAIRTATRYDTASPSPITDAQVTVWLNSEMDRFRRMINAEVPVLYRAVSSTTVIASGAQTISKPNDYEALVRLERLIGSKWMNVEPADAVNMEDGCLGFEEVGSTFLIWPSASAPGSHRLIYGKTATAGTLEVPPGLEDVVTEKVCARVKERLAPAEAQMHLSIADRIWAEQLPLLRRRLGRNVQSGFRPSYRGT